MKYQFLTLLKNSCRVLSRVIGGKHCVVICFFKLRMVNTKNVLPQSYFKKSLWKYHEHYNISYHIESYEIKGTSVKKIERYFRDLIIFERLYSMNVPFMLSAFGAVDRKSKISVTVQHGLNQYETIIILEGSLSVLYQDYIVSVGNLKCLLCT